MRDGMRRQLLRGIRLGEGMREPPRKPRVVPSDGSVVTFCPVMILIIGLVVWWGLSKAYPPQDEAAGAHIVTHDSLAPTYTYDGEVIRWYVLVDPDMDVEYLVNDRGGCTPRLDRYGNVMGVIAYE